MANLIHLIYASKALSALSKQEVQEILEISRTRNQRLEISGMLLFENGSFLQVLEGEESQVRQLFSKISQDQRHGNITTIIFESISKRDFANWSMGFSDISYQELNHLEGMNDFFSNQTCMTELDSGRAKKILKAFTAGRWHLG